MKKKDTSAYIIKVEFSIQCSTSSDALHTTEEQQPGLTPHIKGKTTLHSRDRVIIKTSFSQKQELENDSK